ncbi:MAG: LysR family transcriptional regulator [Verrucomicrobiae bacterium]|nr:LysR family transcriptional regulator [Verrucomicrobiae bacterium]
MDDCHWVELRHLRYFAAVAAHGSFNRAAEVLHLTQPALSRQVKDLEGELGVTLLVRGSNSVTLTGSGELFYQEACEVLARADDAVRRVRGEAGKDVLRMGYTSSMTSSIISTVLAKFQATAPGVRIELADLAPREIGEMAGEGRLDLLVGPGLAVPKGIPGFQLSELCRMESVLVLPARHPLAKLKRIPVPRLDGLPLVGLAKDNYPEYVPRARELLKPFGISPSFISLVNDTFATLFVELEAQNAAVMLVEGIVEMLPQTLVARRFAPRLASVPVMMGLPAVRAKPCAAAFARLLIDAARLR